MSPSPTSRAVAAEPLVPIGVLVVDDQMVVREGISRLIACAAIPLRCIGTAATISEALSAMSLLRPDVVVLDADLAGEDGLALIPELVRTAGVLVLTSHGDVETRARAHRLGASAFVEKHQPASEFLDSITAVGSRRRMRGEKPPAAQGPSSPLAGAATSAAQEPTDS
jgi:DNA-binding NarL/FixJ family response regulator